MRKLVLLVACLFVVVSSPSMAAKKQVVKAIGGTNIPGFSLIIDASYDSKFDNFTPGYKMLNVAIVNNSLNVIVMNPEKDQWWIRTGTGDRRQRVIGDLRSEDAAAWNSLSESARNLISYPLLLPIGGKQVIDLFVPKRIAVEKFNELIVTIDSLGATFEILARQ